MPFEAARFMKSRPRRPLTFFWQGLLIVLPVIVLAGLGSFSLRQDRILAQHEATEQAQTIADHLAQSIWTELTSARDPSLPAFKIDRDGQLLFPPPLSIVPTPQPFNFGELSPEQLRLWQSAHDWSRNKTSHQPSSPTKISNTVLRRRTWRQPRPIIPQFCFLDWAMHPKPPESSIHSS